MHLKRTQYFLTTKMNVILFELCLATDGTEMKGDDRFDSDSSNIIEEFLLKCNIQQFQMAIQYKSVLKHLFTEKVTPLVLYQKGGMKNFLECNSLGMMSDHF